jgi:hypothetical protein
MHLSVCRDFFTLQSNYSVHRRVDVKVVEPVVYVYFDFFSHLSVCRIFLVAFELLCVGMLVYWHVGF